MMIIPFRVSETEYSVFVALNQESLDRIFHYDPAEVTLKSLLAPWDRMRLKDVIIGFATAEEEAEVMKLSADGVPPVQLLQKLSRGYAFRPDQGDYEGPYLSIKRTGTEPKQ